MGSPSKGFSVLSAVFYHLFPRGWEEEVVVLEGGGAGQGGVGGRCGARQGPPTQVLVL